MNENTPTPESFFTPADLIVARARKTFDQFGTRTQAKLWILPDGTPVPLNCWHWTWLMANYDVADRFGVGEGVRDFIARGVGEREGRILALRAGFFRANYDRNGGTLTIEGCTQFWTRRIVTTVFVLAADNIGSIDHMDVRLFDEAVTKIEKQKRAQLFESDDSEKIAKIPLISGTAWGDHLVRTYRIIKETKK